MKKLFISVAIVGCLIACNKNIIVDPVAVNNTDPVLSTDAEETDEADDLPDGVENLDQSDAGAKVPGNTVYFQYQNRDDTFRTVYTVTDWYFGSSEPTQSVIENFPNVTTHGETSKRTIAAKGPQYIKSKKFPLGWHIMQTDDGEVVKFNVTAAKRVMINANPYGIYAAPESKLIRVKWKGNAPAKGHYITFFYQQENLLWKDFLAKYTSTWLDSFEGFAVNTPLTAKSVAFRVNAAGPNGYVTTTEDYPAVKGADVNVSTNLKKSAVITFNYAVTN